MQAMMECKQRYSSNDEHYCALKRGQEDERCFNLFYPHLCREEDVYKLRMN